MKLMLMNDNTILPKNKDVQILFNKSEILENYVNLRF